MQLWQLQVLWLSIRSRSTGGFLEPKKPEEEQRALPGAGSSHERDWCGLSVVRSNHGRFKRPRGARATKSAATRACKQTLRGRSSSWSRRVWEGPCAMLRPIIPGSALGLCHNGGHSPQSWNQCFYRESPWDVWCFHSDGTGKVATSAQTFLLEKR